MSVRKSAFAAIILLMIAGCGRDQEVPLPSIPTSEAASRANRKQVVTLTASAIDRLREAQRQSGAQYLRVSVKNSGPSGFQYDLQFDNHLDSENDFLHDSAGIKTVVDKRSSLFLEGATIDWERTPEGQEGFVFDNPNAAKK